MLTSGEVKQLARACGADLVGIAPVSRFEGLPPEQNPSAIKPDTQSVIVLGFQVLRGSLRGIETGSAWGTYSAGTPLQVRVESTYHFCRALEDDGWEAVPLAVHSRDMRNQGVAVSPDRPEPDVIIDMDYAAFAAGLGVIGKAKLFLTPEFGPRQVFTAVLTDLALDPDPVRDDAPCDGCEECAEGCPAKAIRVDAFNEENLPAGIVKWHPIHIESCRICKTGATANPYSTSAEPNRLGAACGRACVAYLEGSGKLSNALSSPFREPVE